MRKKETINYEETRRKDYIKKVQDFVDEMQGYIKECERYANLVSIQNNIENPGKTLYNKFIEIEEIFKDAGISMFTSPNEINQQSVLGSAILEDLQDYWYKSAKSLFNYYKKIISLINDENVKASKGKIKPRFAISGRFDENFEIPEESKRVLSDLMKKYEAKNKELSEYILEDNIVNAMIKHFTGTNIFSQEEPIIYNVDEVYGLLETIEPDLKALGFEDVMPKLIEAVDNRYGPTNPVNPKGNRFAKSSSVQPNNGSNSTKGRNGKGSGEER